MSANRAGDRGLLGDELRRFLDGLYESGRAHDAVTEEHARRMLNITPDTGEFLRMLVVVARCRRVLELGTSNGYSTLWLADACRLTEGGVTTVEHSEEKRALATQNFADARMADWIEMIAGDIGEVAPSLGEFDLVFLDSDRARYVDWWPSLQQAVRPGGLLVADNATSHEAEMAPFRTAVEASEGYRSVLAGVGNGQLLVLKEPSR